MIDVPYEVKKALRDGTYRKNYRFIVLHDDWTEDFTIANDNLIKESVSIDERMCSGDTIKYGLCEGSSLEFQYFEKPNITGRRVQAFVDVDYKKVITQYSWETQEQFSTAFTVTDMSGDCRLYTELDSAWDFVYVTENGTTTQVYPTATESGTIIELGDVTGRTLIVALPVIPAPTADLQLLVPHVGPAILTHPIPLGFFDVKKCSRQASTGIIKVTAYNKLQSEYLDAKANELLSENIEDEDYSGTMSLYKLLQKTMSEYSIDERAPQVYQTNILRRPITSIGNIPPDLFYLMFDENQTSLGKYLHVTDYAFQTIWSENDIYTARMVSNELKAITTKLWDDFFEENPEWENYYIRMYKSDVGWIYAHIRDIIESDDYNDVDMVGSASAPTALIVLKGGMYWQRTPSTSASYIETQYGIHNYHSQDMISTFKYNEKMTVWIDVPLGIWTSNSSDSNQTKDNELAREWSLEFINNYGGIISYDFKKELTPLEQYRITDSFLVSDVTLRELQAAVYESGCQFGQLSRTTDLFSGVELGHSRLLPAETLYPATDLYPGGARLSGSKAMYSKLWADEGNIHKWRYLIITYKGLDDEGNEQDYTLQRTVNNDGTDNYNCSDNWLFRNLVWTAEQIGEYADAMVAKMQGITWFPFEMWCAGLPYLETGDEIEIPLGDQKYVSYVLQRQLKGIQNLQDTYINGTLDIY